MELTIINILLEYDCPLVVAAEDKNKGFYVGVNYQDANSGYDFYFAKPKKSAVKPLLEGSYDLLHVLTKRKTGGYRQGSGWGTPNETIVTKPLGAVEEDILPDSGLFVPIEIASNCAQSLSVHIDGRWGINDLSKFSDLMQDAYAFAFSLNDDGAQSDRQKIDALFRRYPWKGGFSSVNFFDSLYAAIPLGERAAISRIQYASPGQIELNMDSQSADLIRKLVFDINSENSKAQESYKEVYKWLGTMGWRGKGSDEVILDDFQKQELIRRVKLLCLSFGLSGQTDRVLRLSNSDPLGAVKILLAYFRRLKGLADYVDTGKVQELLI